MSQKHHGLITVCLILSALSSAAVYAFSSTLKADDPASFRKRMLFSDIRVPNQADLREMAQLGKKLDALVRPPESKPGRTNLAIFNNPAGGEKKSNPVRKKKLRKQTGLSDYALTFAFVSDRSQFCMINKKMHTTGDILPGGEKILKIDPGQVLIKRGTNSIWISLNRTPQKKGGR